MSVWSKILSVFKFFIRHQEEVISIAATATDVVQDVVKMTKDKDKDKSVSEIPEAAVEATGVVVEIIDIVKDAQSELKDDPGMK